MYIFCSFDVNSVQLPDCSIIITVLDFNGGVIKDHFIGRLVLGREASGESYILYHVIHFHFTQVKE